jgi:hypothetical protein
VDLIWIENKDNPLRKIKERKIQKSEKELKIVNKARRRIFQSQYRESLKPIASAQRAEPMRIQRTLTLCPFQGRCRRGRGGSRRGGSCGLSYIRPFSSVVKVRLVFEGNGSPRREIDLIVGRIQPTTIRRHKPISSREAKLDYNVGTFPAELKLCFGKMLELGPITDRKVMVRG